MRPLLISIGMQLREGPWGGGNQFGRALVAYLESQGEKVSFDLEESNLDVVMLTPSRGSASYTYKDVVRYQRRRNPRVLVVHRINECDERKGSHDMNRWIVKTNTCADHTVFVASWLKELLKRQGLRWRADSVILNGSDTRIFNPSGHVPWDGKGPLRIVTHHWSSNWLKGFDIYEALDGMLASPPWRDKLRFTYIGRLPKGFQFRHAQHIAPCDGEAMAAELKHSHVYLTASQNEPGGNHQNEGALCGLPILYRESGCMPEYCSGYGVGFVPETFEEQLKQMMASYHEIRDRMTRYPNTAERMTEQYRALFQDLVSRRDQVIAARPRRSWLSSLLRARGVS